MEPEAILMSTDNKCFYGEIAKILPKLSSNTLICSTEKQPEYFGLQ